MQRTLSLSLWGFETPRAPAVPPVTPTRPLLQGSPFQVTQEEVAEQNPSNETSLGRGEGAPACRATRMDLGIVPNSKASTAIFKEKLHILHGKQLDFY